MQTKITIKILSFIFLIFQSLQAFAFSTGSVTQVKNNKVLIDFKTETPSVGDQFYIISAENKKVAIVQITTAKNNKALADILKGTATVGATTQAKNQSGSSSGSQSSSTEKESAFIRSDLIQLGFHLKYMMNSMATKLQDNTLPFAQQETVTMTGSNIGFGASMDLPIYDGIKIHGLGTYEILDIKATSQFLSCGGKSSTDCNTTITYLALQGLARFDFTKSKFNLWGGFGGTFKMPLSKKSTALDEGGITYAQSITAAFGLDYQINNKSYIPFTFEYQYSLNKSDTVPNIDQMSILAGYGIKF